MKQLTILLLSAFSTQLAAFGQGALTPPGAVPAPTMKTLQQVEPRTPITNATAVTISASGSYYLTTNITVATGDAITIAADNVTLDLNGFTVSSTNPVATGMGIYLSGSRAHIHILNGHIRGNVTYSGGVYSGSGFAYGISCTLVPRNVRVTGVSVSGCQLGGIVLLGMDPLATVVESCTVQTVGGLGISAQSIFRSTAVGCGSSAIYAHVAIDCYGNSTGSVESIWAEAADNCVGFSSGLAEGVFAGAANNCVGTSNGRGLWAYTASNCRGYSRGSGQGLWAGDASNCSGISESGTGLSADTADNCQGESYGAGNGLVASHTATGCYGKSSSGTGLYTDYAATGCYGESSTGSGLNTVTALNCYGKAGGVYNGLLATTASNCYGYNSAHGNGLFATSAANNCYGQSSSGTGLYAAYTAIGCRGVSTTGTGLQTSIANSCTGSGTPALNVTNKYDMP